MGGSKNKSPAKREKSQSKPDSKKSKKTTKPESAPPKAAITVILTDEQASKFIGGAKVVTVHELARQTGVKVSAANAYLRAAVSSGRLKVAGGHSGHRVYAPV